MINVKLTLYALHDKFPNLSLDDLFNILECIVAEYKINPIDTTRWYDTNITYNH